MNINKFYVKNKVKLMKEFPQDKHKLKEICMFQVREKYRGGQSLKLFTRLKGFP